MLLQCASTSSVQLFKSPWLLSYMQGLWSLSLGNSVGIYGSVVLSLDYFLSILAHHGEISMYSIFKMFHECNRVTVAGLMWIQQIRVEFFGNQVIYRICVCEHKYQVNFCVQFSLLVNTIVYTRKNSQPAASCQQARTKLCCQL